jgi:hypothetical protein
MSDDNDLQKRWMERLGRIDFVPDEYQWGDVKTSVILQLMCENPSLTDWEIDDITRDRLKKLDVDKYPSLDDDNIDCIIRSRLARIDDKKVLFTYRVLCLWMTNSMLNEQERNVR